MVNKNISHRILYVAGGFIILGTLLLYWVLHNVKTDTTGIATPDMGVPFLWIIIIIHLLIVAALVWTIFASGRGRSINKELLVASGIIPILFGLLFWYAGISFLNTTMHSTGIILFVCAGCDMVAAILALITRIFWRSKKATK
ncbi:MAG TPA: hypothetical protein VLQ91_17260 [Draconibacterium sp.]|nr:hypothetical protein [Draconibacterium sp.]